jgi:hypothetical protein
MCCSKNKRGRFCSTAAVISAIETSNADNSDEDDEEIFIIEEYRDLICNEIVIAEEGDDEIEMNYVDEDENEEDNQEITENQWEDFLKWNSNAQTKVSVRGESERTQRRYKASERNLQEAGAANNSSIKSFFPTVASISSTLESSDNRDNSSDIDDNLSDIDDNINKSYNYAATIGTLTEKVKCMESNDIVKNRQQSSEFKTGFQRKQAAVTLKYLSLRQNGSNKMDASQQVANLMYDKTSRHSYKARSIRTWGETYLETGAFIRSKQGKHPKIYSLIQDEAAREKFLKHLRSIPTLQRTPEQFCRELNNGLLHRLSSSRQSVNIDTARRWMKFLGFEATVAKKNYFVDGHEREDVVEYRLKFLNDMQNIERKLSTWNGTNTDTETKPILKANEKRSVFVVHDESTFYTNDAARIIWMENGKNEIRPKTKGSSIMVSGFCCECCGFLEGIVGSETVHSYQFLEAGTNRGGWWTNEDLVQQLNKVIPLFKLKHPDCDLIFAFDNSQNHHAMAPDALVANRLNKSDGGKNIPKLRNGKYHDGTIHEMQLNDENNTQKGIQTILTERGVWVKCNLPNAREILSQQNDFRSQMSWLEETVVNQGCAIIFFPKYHCELNFIEMIWGFLKAKLRRACTFLFNDLKIRLKEYISTIQPGIFRRFARHCFRYMSGYRLNMVGPLLDYAVKKYKCHRCIPSGSVKAVENEYHNYL